MMNRVFRSTAGKRAFSSGVVFTPDYAFEMASSTVRVGRGVTKEVGQDLLNLGLSKNVCVFTDPYMATLPPMKAVLESLTKAKIQFDVFDRVAVEPTDASLQIAIQHCKAKNYDGFIAVGGGSVMDTAKAANVYMCNPNNEFLDFVNAPVGKGMPVPNKLKPLIAIPTTAGTGSETTGVAIFDHTPTGAKTGIRDRSLRPILGIIDPDHTATCGRALTAYNGLDVLCHALESYTAVPYNQRITGVPAGPQFRPAYQGSNSISDIWSGFALQQCSKYLLRAVEGDPYAREQMCLASTAAGVGFGTIRIPWKRAANDCSLFWFLTSHRKRWSALVSRHELPHLLVRD
jgi:hydroxyacid-oxoacid transhydrogenase